MLELRQGRRSKSQGARTGLEVPLGERPCDDRQWTLAGVKARTGLEVPLGESPVRFQGIKAISCGARTGLEVSLGESNYWKELEGAATAARHGRDWKFL